MPEGSPQYSATGFQRFMDRLLMHGLEWLGLYYGTYRALVIDNEDEKNLGRLKVRVPAIGDTDQNERIAFPIAPIAGNGFGFKSLPPKGGFCYVEFENGRPEIPLWKGGWWRIGDMPPDLRPVDAHGWFTPGGHQILLTDEDGAQTVRVKHSNGAVVEMDKDGNISIFNSTDTGEGASLTSKVFVGIGANEAAILGDTLKGLLEETLDAVVSITVPTSVGPSGPPINSAQFTSIKSRLATALSQTVVVK